MENLTDPIEYDLEPVRVPVTCRGRKLVLTENADAVIKYNNAQAKAMRLNDNKVVGVDGIADADAILIQGCLFEVTEKGDGPLAMSYVRSLPPKLFKQLVSRALTINGILKSRSKETIQAEIDVLRKELGKASQSETETSSDSLTNLENRSTN